jgi:hypothetical protein
VAHITIARGTRRKLNTQNATDDFPDVLNSTIRRWQRCDNMIGHSQWHPATTPMQFSLRQLFGFVTLCAVLSYLGVTIYNQYIAVAQLKHFLASHHVEVSDKNGVLTIDFNGHSIGSTPELVYSVINIRRYLPDVRELYFSDCEFYRIAPELSGWSSLRVLGSAYCKVTDEDLRAMMPLPNLRVLDLMGSRVTSSGLRECKNVNHLQRIWLRSTPANDDSCDWLSEQSELRYVDLSESQITDIGVIRLIE